MISGLSCLGRILRTAATLTRYSGRNGQTISAACVQCLNLQTYSFHTGPPQLAVRTGKSKKKIIKEIKVTRKKKKKDLPVVEIYENMTINELANITGRDIDAVCEAVSTASDWVHSPRANQTLRNVEVIKKAVLLLGQRCLVRSKKNIEKQVVDRDAYPRPSPQKDQMVKRPPVVAIMGHVDHGKTTLLDTLRHSNVVAHEFGGITQHIGAFTVKLDRGDEITFLDTPGHAAFHAMRSRGAHVTDIVVLVVAADDGVMEQTVESIKHAQDAKVPMIIAINKIDKPQADIAATKTMLVQAGLEIEDYGGDIQVIPLSAVKGTNINNLQEAIVALAEVLEIKCDPLGLVEASVVESRTDPHKGKLSTALIQRGCLKKGDVLVAGEAWCKVRAMYDHNRAVNEARPGKAVEVMGWKDLPHAGQQILQVQNEKRAQEVIHYRQHLAMDKKAEEDMAVYNKKMEEHKKEYNELRLIEFQKGKRWSNIYRSQKTKETIETHTGPELAIVVKGDVDGSVEAILNALETYHSEECRLHLLSHGVGEVAPHDIELAADFNGVVFAFNSGINKAGKTLAETKGVSIHEHNIIYKMIDDVKDLLQQRLPPLQREEIIGQADVLAFFQVKEGHQEYPVAGCRCTKGTLIKKQLFRLERRGDVIYEGKLHSMKHLKTEVESIKIEVECGLTFADSTIIPEIGDSLVCYKNINVPQELDWDLGF